MPKTASADPQRTRELNRDIYSLAMDAAGIDGELALAFAMISSDDEEEQQQGEALVQQLLEVASASAEALTLKADSICTIIESTRARAAFLKEAGQARIAKGKAEEAAADKLLARVTAALHTVHPGQTRFQLPEHDLRSRLTKRVIVDPEQEAKVPDRLKRMEVKIKFAAKPDEPVDYQRIVDALLATISELDADCDLTYTFAPDAKAIAAAIEAGEKLPGCRIQPDRSWRLD